MASPTQWTWVWAGFRSWWWTGKPDVLQSMGLQSQIQLSNWTELNWWPMIWNILPMHICHLYVCSDPAFTFKVGHSFSYYCVLGVVCIFLTTSLIKYAFCKHFLPICALSFHSLDSVFHRAEIFHFNEVHPAYQYFLSWITSLDIKGKNYKISGI